MDELWEEFIECFREETKMLFDQVNEYCYYYIFQGQRKQSGCSGFGRTSFSQGKNEIQFLQKAINKQKC